MDNSLSTTSNTIAVEVVYALPHRQYYYYLTLPAMSTVAQAIQATQLTTLRPEIDLSAIGIYSQAVSLTTLLNSGDRVEIYRPITADAKELRQRRLNKKNPQ